MPVAFRDACAFITDWHRHHRPPAGAKFCIGVADAGEVLRGVAIVGRPVARMLDNGHTLEVTRLAADGTPNACSALYSGAWRAARALGYRRLITYTRTRFLGPTCGLECGHGSCGAVRRGESGASLLAAGWRVVAERPPRPGWSRPSRPRARTGHEWVARSLWEPDPGKNVPGRVL
ncbi:XF1762 family protein [Actinomadura yumaensis]|uniref:XF1762 family protein n=1 Tax=Actinomadura yumaensis TaxID=111807 RepID=UPI003620AEEB